MSDFKGCSESLNEISEYSHMNVELDQNNAYRAPLLINIPIVVRPEFDINILYQRWKDKQSEIQDEYEDITLRPPVMRRQYRKLDIKKSDLQKFINNEIQDCEVDALGGGYYNKSWGIYRDIETNETFVYHITRDLNRTEDFDYGIRSFNFISRSIEKIISDTIR